MKISLQNRFFLLVLASLFCFALIAGVGTLLILQSGLARDARTALSLFVDQKAISIDRKLRDAQMMTNMLASQAASSLVSVDELKNEQYQKEYLSPLSELALDSVSDLYGVNAVYVRFIPEIAGGKLGFFYLKKKNDEHFSAGPMTDLASLPNGVRGSMGWFYAPISYKKAVWIAPYRDFGIDIAIFSYVTPIQKDGQIIGVVGVDLDYAEYSSLVRDKSGINGLLVDLSDTNLGNDPCFQNTCSIADGNATVSTHLADFIHGSLLRELKSTTTSGNVLKTIDIDGTSNYIAFRPLRNGMKYLVYADESGLYQKEKEYLKEYIILSITVFIAFCLIGFGLTWLVLSRFKALRIWSLRLVKDRIPQNEPVVDDIGDIKINMLALYARLKNNTKEADNLAFKDSLTGLKNRPAYNEHIKNMLKEHHAHYGLALFNISGIKKLNEEYGHAAGDAMIALGARVICDIFRHSPVFRLGSDEFAALLTGEDYENKEQLFVDLEQIDEKINIEPHANLRIAGGLALSTNGASYSEVFAMANKDLREKRKALKRRLKEEKNSGQA